MLDGSATQSGVISELGGARGFEKIGTGTLTLTGANTYTGATRISAGTLALGAANVIPNASAVRITGGTLALGGFTDTVASVELQSGAITGTTGNQLNVNGTYGQSGGTLASGATVVVTGAKGLSGGTISGTLGGAGLTSIAGGTVNSNGAILGGIATIGIGGVLNLIGDSRVATLDFNGGELTASANATLSGSAVGPRLAGHRAVISAADGVTLRLESDFFHRGNGSLAPNTITTFGAPGKGGTVEIATRFLGDLGPNALSFIAEGTVRIGSVAAGVGLLDNDNGNTSGVITRVNATLDLNSFRTDLANLDGTGTILNNGAAATLLTLQSSQNSTFGGVIGNGTSAVAIDKVQNGTLTLTGNNSYTGTTTISAGTLRIGNGGTTGTLGSGNVVNNAALVFNRSDNVTLAGALSGTGTLTKLGTGALTLSGNNNFTGTTFVNEGTLTLASLNALGIAHAGTIVAAGATLATNSSVLVAGPITLNGDGFNNGGALRATSGSSNTTGLVTLGSNSRITADGGSFIIVNGLTGADFDLTLDVANSISFISQVSLGAGRLIKNGAGNFNMFRGDAQVRELVINGGRVQFGENSGAANTAISDLAHVHVGNAVLSLSLSETIGSLSGDALAFVGTTASSATLTVGGNNASTLFAGRFTTSSPISVTKVGTGTLTLTGNSFHTGTTTISQGTLQIGNGGTTGTLGLGNVVNDANLVFNRSNNLTIGNVISGSGTVTQSGSGMLTLTGANTFTGLTSVLGGTLMVNGSLASDVLVAGGTLGGTGTIGGF
ncbi:MAG: autotransporter-associated beta strand repeat-containing protein, partial [Porphyrobacter sp.]|nr:autotransporter-associated beta strand repeat-containing protein [Porphyrobacter sp.]